VALLLECCAPHGIGPVVTLNAVARYDLPDSANSAIKSSLVSHVFAAAFNRWRLMKTLAGTPAQCFGHRLWVVRDAEGSFCVAPLSCLVLPGGVSTLTDISQLPGNGCDCLH